MADYQMRSDQQCRDMLRIALEQERVSRARDYWQGVTDGLGFALGELPDALQAHLVADRARRTRNEHGADAGDPGYPLVAE